MKDGSENIAQEFKDLTPPAEESKDQAIIRLRKEGKSYREIKKELGVGQARIAEVLQGAGLLGEQRRREEAKKAMVLFDEEILVTLIEIPFDYFAKRYGEFWKLSQDEKKKLSTLSNRVASKWLPLWLERFGDEIALGLTFSMIVYPRYIQTKEMIESEKKSQKKMSSLSQEDQAEIS